MWIPLKPPRPTDFRPFLSLSEHVFKEAGEVKTIIIKCYRCVLLDLLPFSKPQCVEKYWRSNLETFELYYTKQKAYFLFYDYQLLIWFSLIVFTCNVPTLTLVIFVGRLWFQTLSSPKEMLERRLMVLKCIVESEEVYLRELEALLMVTNTFK